MFPKTSRHRKTILTMPENMDSPIQDGSTHLLLWFGRICDPQEKQQGELR